MAAPKIDLSVIIPIYNEEMNLVPMNNRIIAALSPLGIQYEIVYVNDGSNDYYLIKNAPIQNGGTLQIIDGGAKYVIQSADVLKVVSDTASSCDVWVSAVDAISD